MSNITYFKSNDGKIYKLEREENYVYMYSYQDMFDETKKYKIKGAHMKNKWVFKAHNLDVGIVLTNKGEIDTVLVIKGVFTDNTKSFMDIIGKPLEENSKDKSVYAVININNEGNLDTKYLREKLNTVWKEVDTKKYITKYFKYTLPTKYKESIIALINKTAQKLNNDIEKFTIDDINSSDMQKVLENLQIQEAIKELKTYKKELIEYLNKIKKESKTNIEEFINRYSFKEHILLVGPSGFSKTHTASKYLTDNKIDTEYLIGHEAIESIDMLGYYVKNETGNLVWMDGPLTSAFRKAKDHKVALFIDEILRIPSKELNILVGSLTPNSEDKFVLRTNRIIDIKDGLGVSETLIIPKENLWVIATTNIGSDYDVNEIDKALNDRFIQLDVEPDDEIVRSIIMSVGSSKFEEEYLNKLYEVYLLVKKMVDNKELPHYLNVRNLVRVINNANKPSELKKYLRDITPQVVSRNADGKLNQVEMEIYYDIIESKF